MVIEKNVVTTLQLSENEVMALRALVYDLTHKKLETALDRNFGDMAASGGDATWNQADAIAFLLQLKDI